MSDDVPVITLWKGRPIEDLSREELIEALPWAGMRLAEYESIVYAMAHALEIAALA